MKYWLFRSINTNKFRGLSRVQSVLTKYRVNMKLCRLTAKLLTGYFGDCDHSPSVHHQNSCLESNSVTERSFMRTSLV